MSRQSAFPSQYQALGMQMPDFSHLAARGVRAAVRVIDAGDRQAQKMNYSIRKKIGWTEMTDLIKPKHEHTYLQGMR